MKALKIYETINFKRGENPHKNLEIGDYREYEVGTIFQVLQSLYYIKNVEDFTAHIYTSFTWSVTPDEHMHLVLFKNDIIELAEITDGRHEKFLHFTTRKTNQNRHHNAHQFISVKWFQENIYLFDRIK